MTDTAFPNLAPTLKSLLEEHNLTASDLARRTGISVATLSRLLHGTGNPSFENICRIAHALDVPLGTFAPTTPQEAPSPTPTNETDTVFALFELTSPDHTPASAAGLLLSAARGQPLPSWVQTYTNPQVAETQVISSTQVGNQRFQVTLGFPASHVEAGSIASLLAVAGSGLAGTHAQLKDLTIPATLLRTFNGPAFGMRGLRDTFNKHGRPLLMATVRPMAGVSPRQYARVAFESLVGGMDITADPSMLHHTPENPWRERFRFLAEATLTAGQQTNEYKSHAVNITAATLEDMQERALWAKDLDLATVLVDPSVCGWSALQSMARWCRNHDMLLCAMGNRPLWGVMLSEQLQARLLRFAGADVVSTASPLRGNVSNRRLQTGVLNALRDATTPANTDIGLPLAQSCHGIAASAPALGGGHNPWHFPRLLDATGDNTIIQCGGSIVAHPWGSQSGAMANRTALEATVQARNEGLNLNVENRTILQRAAKFSPELKEALRHWQEGSFQFGVIHGTGERNKPTEGTVVTPTPSDNITLFRRPSEPPVNPPENTEE